MPSVDFTYDWYHKAYVLLLSSANQNGVIPLSEILTYTEHFGTIGSKEEFIHIIRHFEHADREHRKNSEKVPLDKHKNKAKRI